MSKPVKMANSFGKWLGVTLCLMMAVACIITIGVAILISIERPQLGNTSMTLAILALCGALVLDCFAIRHFLKMKPGIQGRI